MNALAVLADFCDLALQQVDPRFVDPSCLYLGLEHLASSRMKPIASGCAGDVHSLKYAFQAGDVLYGKLRPYLDKSVLSDSAGVCTTELLVLRPKQSIDPRFLACLVHTPGFVEYSMAGVTGAHHPRTSWAHIRQFQLPRFALAEQVAIADLIWHVHDLVATCEASAQIALKLKFAVMHQLFTRGLRGESQKETKVGLIPRSWQYSTLGELAKLERGRFLHRPRNEPRFYGGNTPFIQTSDVVQSYGRIKKYSQTLNDEGVAISRIFPAGTVLITIAANIGFTGILQFDCACPDSLIAITPNHLVKAEFLEYWLQTQRDDIDRLAPKGTQKNINIQFLSPWPVIIPDLDEQNEIVSILDAIDRKIDLHRRKRAVLEEIFKSLLHKLMTGEVRVDQFDLSGLDNRNRHVYA